jgi:hypothetical protein
MLPEPPVTGSAHVPVHDCGNAPSGGAGVGVGVGVATGVGVGVGGAGGDVEVGPRSDGGAESVGGTDADEGDGVPGATAIDPDGEALGATRSAHAPTSAPARSRAARLVLIAFPPGRPMGRRWCVGPS